LAIANLKRNRFFEKWKDQLMGILSKEDVLIQLKPRIEAHIEQSGLLRPFERVSQFDRVTRENMFNRVNASLKSGPIMGALNKQIADLLEEQDDLVNEMQRALEKEVEEVSLLAKLNSTRPRTPETPKNTENPSEIYQPSQPASSQEKKTCCFGSSQSFAFDE